MRLDIIGIVSLLIANEVGQDGAIFFTNSFPVDFDAVRVVNARFCKKDG